MYSIKDNLEYRINDLYNAILKRGVNNMKTIIELREEAIEKDINPECYLYQKLEKQQRVLDKIKEYIKEYKNCVPKHISDYILKLLEEIE